MKKIANENKNYLLSSILFLLLGIILFTNPGGILKFLSYITGGLLIIIAIINFIEYSTMLKKLNIGQTNKIISGVVLVILGLIVILFSSLIETTIRLIFGCWIIYSGIMKLISSFELKEDQTRFYVELTISIILIICGFYVALTDLAYKMIGLFIMIYAILDIVSYVMNKKNVD